MVWERFVDPATPLGVLATCDGCLSKMSPGWRTHPARYDVMARALRRQSVLKLPPEERMQDQPMNYQFFESKLMPLSHAPGLEVQTSLLKPFSGMLLRYSAECCGFEIKVRF